MSAKRKTFVPTNGPGSQVGGGMKSNAQMSGVAGPKSAVGMNPGMKQPNQAPKMQPNNGGNASQMAPHQRAPAHPASGSVSQVKTPEQAMAEFQRAKREAQARQKHKLSANQRLVTSMADITVALLAKCLQSKIDDKIEIRLYKKPQFTGQGYAVAEYRSASSEEEKERRKRKGNQQDVVDDDFIVIMAGELLGRDGERDVVENWVKFFDVVQKSSLWLRYCWSVHKRIGWKTKLERSLLNMVDGRVLGFVTISISNFV